MEQLMLNINEDYLEAVEESRYGSGLAIKKNI